MNEKTELDKLTELLWRQDVVTGITWDDCVLLALRIIDRGFHDTAALASGDLRENITCLVCKAECINPVIGSIPACSDAIIKANKLLAIFEASCTIREQKARTDGYIEGHHQGFVDAQSRHHKELT